MRLKENEMLEQLDREINRYAPLSIKSIVTGDNGAEAIIEFCISNGPHFKALVEIKPVATPKIITQMTQYFFIIQRSLNEEGKIPLLIVPYMGAEQAKILQQKDISWIDLCGNMMIKVGNKIYIERTGQKNIFPDTSPIKKIFEGTSSFVSRALLLKKEPFQSLYEVVNYINDKGENITLATVSKVLKSLEEELLITKTEAGISVTNREKLLDKIWEGYRNYTSRNENEVYKFAVENIRNLFDVFYQRQVKYASCGFYAAQCKGLATTDRITIYIKSINDAKKAFELDPSNIKADSEFGQLELIETKNPCIWFNLQDRPFNIVDDAELYLEMMIDTPRGPKIAEILKERILRGQE